MAAPNRPGPSRDVDLEATDELPALDLADTVEAQVNTDIFPGPVIPAGMAELADSLRDVEHRLQRKIERVQKLESELQLAGTQQQQLEIAPARAGRGRCGTQKPRCAPSWQRLRSSRRISADASRPPLCAAGKTQADLRRS